jgi:uncharacterized protein YgiB involved in biofilm formation
MTFLSNIPLPPSGSSTINVPISDCYSYEEADECAAKNGTYYRRQCYQATEAALKNITQQADQEMRRPPAEEYFT